MSKHIKLFEEFFYFPSQDEINAHIQKKYPKLEVVFDDDVTYWYSDDKDLGLYLAGLYSSSIDADFKDQSLDKWLDMADDIMKDYSPKSNENLITEDEEYDNDFENNSDVVKQLMKAKKITVNINVDGKNMNVNISDFLSIAKHIKSYEEDKFDN